MSNVLDDGAAGSSRSAGAWSCRNVSMLLSLRSYENGQPQLTCTSWTSGHSLRASSPRMLRFTPNARAS